MATEVLTRCRAAGVRLRAERNRLIAAPRGRLTDELCDLIRANKAALLAALPSMPEPAGRPSARSPTPGEHGYARTVQAPSRGADCMSCVNLKMRFEYQPDTRRVWWWRCMKSHALMEGRNFGERVLLAPPECDAAGDFQQWKPG